jgi:hypothetical protein
MLVKDRNTGPLVFAGVATLSVKVILLSPCSVFRLDLYLSRI